MIAAALTWTLRTAVSDFSAVESFGEIFIY
jgi:hypothetical protein